jgi:hypothetical protein
MSPADPLVSLLPPLLTWRDILLAYAVLLAVEGPALFALSYRYGRRSYERLVALAPAAGFAWVLHLARAAQDLHDSWQFYFALKATYYSPAFPPAVDVQDRADLQASVSGVTSLGWIACAVTAVLLTFGWALALRWKWHREPSLKAAPTTAPIPASTSAPTLPAAALGDEGGELEITVEPLDSH